MTFPKVSICIPSYNGRRHLRECLDSVRAQSFADFEVVICDDQSSDGTLDLARELAGGDRRFRFSQNSQRLGLVGNWNRCIEQSRGKWIKFVFQDDTLAPSCLEALLNACERTGKSFAFCRRELDFAPDTSKATLDFFASHEALMNRIYSDVSQLESKDFVRLSLEHWPVNLVGEPTCTLLSRQLFRDFGLFDPALIQDCDTEFWRRAGGHTGIAVVSTRLATFRVHGDSATSTNVRLRTFRKEVIEPFVQEYHLLFNPHYRPFRAAVPSPPGLLRQRIRFSRKAAGMRREALKNNPDEWRQVAQVHRLLTALAGLGSLANGFQSLRRILRNPPPSLPAQ